MSSSTSRLQLTKLADSENFSNTVLNANWDKVDNGYGTLNSQIGNIQQTDQKYANNATTHTFTLETGCLYLVCIDKLNSADANVACGLYMVQAHSGNSAVRTIAASSGVTSISISGLTLTVVIGSTYTGVSVIRVGKW